MAKLTFTGSDATGARIYAQAAQKMKRVTLELGGKSPNIVFDDCDLDQAAAGAISGIFAATGQTCIAGSRLLVHNSIREAFVKRVVEIGATARKGNPMSPDTNIGPVTTPAQYKKILEYIDIAKAEGARCILGGGPAISPDLPTTPSTVLRPAYGRAILVARSGCPRRSRPERCGSTPIAP